MGKVSEQISEQSSDSLSIVYKPSEIIGIFNSLLARQSVNAQVVYMRGVYMASGRQAYGGYYYDTLKDEDTADELTLRITEQQRNSLKNGNLVNVGGVISRSVNQRGMIQIMLNVSRVEVVQEQTVDENELKRIELRQRKVELGYKNVDAILEQLLYVDKRPQVALLFASSSITMSDFNAGVEAAKCAIDFEEYRANFSNQSELISVLQEIDEENFDVVALVRGGGSQIEKLDDLSVLEAVVNMNTPVIAAVGHVEEKIFIKQLADKCAPTPNGLGQYFKDMVEEVSEKKSKSRAAITEQIKKQFQEQIEAGKKQNNELQEKLKTLTKNQEEQVKAQQKQSEAMEKLQTQLKEQTTLNEKQSKEFNESLKKITDLNIEAQKKLENSDKRVKELEAQLAEANLNSQKTIRMVVAVSLVLLALVVVIGIFV